jgi:hypothetical protein
MLAVEEKMEKGKRERKEMVGRQGAPLRKLPPLSTYVAPPLTTQYKVNAKAEQPLKVNEALFKFRDGFVKFHLTGRTAKELHEQASQIAKDFGPMEYSYPVFEGSYKEAVDRLRKTIKAVLQISEDMLAELPEVPLEHHLCLLADYRELLSHLAKEIEKQFDLVDTIYQYLEQTE